MNAVVTKPNKSEIIQKLHKALSFYASEETHEIFSDEKGFLITEYIRDNGEIAKKILAELESVNPEIG